MKTLNLIIAIILINLNPALIYSQVNKSRQNFFIKYDAVSLLGDQVSTSMGFQLGIEWMTPERQGFCADIMFIFPNHLGDQSYTRIATEKTTGLLVSCEYRIYLFPSKNRDGGFHVGPLVAYQYTCSLMHETYNNGIPNDYHVIRHEVRIHGKAGYQLRIAGPLYFNPGIGLGFRYISSRSENKKGPDPGQKEFLYNKDYESGARWFPGFDISIKIGLKI